MREPPWKQDLRLRMARTSTPLLGQEGAPEYVEELQAVLAAVQAQAMSVLLPESFLFDIYRLYLDGLDADATAHILRDYTGPPPAYLPALGSLARADAKWAAVHCVCFPLRRETKERRVYNLRLPVEQADWVDQVAVGAGDTPQGVIRSLIRDAMGQP